MSRIINLTRGQVALVDDEDHEELSKFKWYAQQDKRKPIFYAARRVRLSGKFVPEWLHRRVLGLPHGDKRQGDHINHDTLDNRRKNLRIVTSRENNSNRRRPSRYGVGVHLHLRGKTKRYQAQVWVAGKRHYVGWFHTPEEAQAARRAWLKEVSK